MPTFLLHCAQFMLRWPGRLACLFGFHAWAPSEVHGPSVQYCARPKCLVTMKLTTRGWETFLRKEVTLEQVERLNRKERRRLGTLARRGAFGKIPEK